MRKKRYSKDMKGTQEEEKESYPYFDLFPIEREIVRRCNQDDRFAFKVYVRLTENGKYGENVNMLELYFLRELAKDEENKEEAEKVLKEVFAGKGLKLEQECANNYKTTFFIKGKLII